MKYFGKIIAALFLLATFNITAQEINTSKSTVKFLAGKTEGSIGGLKGTATFDETNLANAAFDVTIEIKTINTGTEKRDEHLKTADFFDAGKYPTASFTSTGATAINGGFETKGTLNMHGIKKNAKIKFTYDAAKKKFVGKMTVDSSDFKIAKEGKYDGVTVDITCYLN
jgi:polyisoprenoid-binding protein YceI